MSTNTRTQAVARIATVIAMAALLVAGFAPLVQAQTTTVTTTTSASFTRDLTIGSTGADVTALQTWLIAKGFSIPAGATGYFGAQTKAALASFQAANTISPAAGYFGSITRAKVNSVLGQGGTTNPPSNNGGSGALRGGEADLKDFAFKREDTSGSEGEQEVEMGTVSFDVEDGDIRIERFDLIASSTNSTLNQQPWRYFDRVVLLADGKEIADMDVDNRNDWDRRGDTYRLSLTGLKQIVRENDTAEITVAFDIADNIDTANLAQKFSFYVPERGIRAVDAAGIQQYTGDDSETLTFGFDEEESGDLRIRTNSDDPDATTLISDERKESDDYTVLVFDLENRDEVDTIINDLTVDVASSEDVRNVIRRATLSAGGDDFDGDITATGIEFEDMDLEIAGDDEETFELTVRLARNAPNTTLRFSVDSADIEAEGTDSGDDADVSGSVNSETHTVARTGITVSARSTDARTNDSQTQGTFRVTFDVTALEDDVYIYNGADAGDNDATPFSEVASTTGVVYTVFQGSNASTTITGDSALLQSGAERVGNYYLVREGDTETFTLTVSIDPATVGTDLYYVVLDAVRFDNEMTSGTGDDSVHLIPTTRGFLTNPVSITG